MIGFVVLGYAIYWAAKAQAAKVDNFANWVGRRFTHPENRLIL